MNVQRIDPGSRIYKAAKQNLFVSHWIYGLFVVQNIGIYNIISSFF